MMYKIIQIAPMHTKLWANYRDGKRPCVCIALVEDERGQREVRWLTANKYGSIEPANGRYDRDFTGIEWEEE